MPYVHRGAGPAVDPSAYLAPTAVLCGDVRVGPGCAIQFGAVLSAEDGSFALGRECVVMPNAVVLANRHTLVAIGDHVLFGPRTYLSDCTIEGDVFLATGSSVFNKAIVGSRAEVQINGVVHVRTRIPPGATVPIGWVAVGDPAEILSPDQHERIWAIQRSLGFAKTVWGLDRAPRGETIMAEAMPRYAQALQGHRDDAPVAGEPSGSRP